MLVPVVSAENPTDVGKSFRFQGLARLGCRDEWEVMDAGSSSAAQSLRPRNSCKHKRFRVEGLGVRGLGFNSQGNARNIDGLLKP